MPVQPNATAEVSAFGWVPDFAKGVVRDLRVRWALEEAGRPYRERLLQPGKPQPHDYLHEQPFGQVPAYRDEEVQLFESGAIVLHIGEGCEALLPSDPAARKRAVTWVLAALNTVEPYINPLIDIDLFNPGAAWGQERRPAVVEQLRKRLSQLSAWLGDKDYLEDRFTAGDLMMTTVLRELRHTDLLDDYPNLAAYKARCEARPAFQAALAAHVAPIERSPAPAMA